MDWFNVFLKVWILLAIIIFPVQLFITAPYGRHFNTKWGIGMPNQWGWVLMESVSILMMFGFFLFSIKEKSTVAWFLFILWIAHYFHRSFIYPFRTHTRLKKIPISIVGSAIFFNIINAGTNGFYLGYLENYDENWFFDFRFVFGLLLFMIGTYINITSDNYLIGLRKKNEDTYSVPSGGLFNYISCPNHFGEMLEWIGYAFMCWNLPALGFCVWTMANLIPRAKSHHLWYKKFFVDYPINRKAVIPFIF
ncbi:MAG: DUF1295 domain-containing protein [Saprospiraceae bacterium]|nr:DUF1295 domain-containing protein [Saprospiraceae bacterium]